MTVFAFGKDTFHDQRPAMAQDILAQIFLSVTKTAAAPVMAFQRKAGSQNNFSNDLCHYFLVHGRQNIQ